MKKFNKIISTVVASALAVSMLAACGSGAQTSGSDSSNGGTFKIGAIGPLTGAAAAYGNAVVNGAKIAV
ncbi:MAG: amino acid ABC transporter substrate-binding protein, partial [Butyrivibrio sp.]|nr:amino acid ABC transporter substrate-binding protein [Butyrivibrio sp.]